MTLNAVKMHYVHICSESMVHLNKCKCCFPWRGKTKLPRLLKQVSQHRWIYMRQETDATNIVLKYKGFDKTERVVYTNKAQRADLACNFLLWSSPRVQNSASMAWIKHIQRIFSPPILLSNQQWSKHILLWSRFWQQYGNTINIRFVLLFECCMQTEHQIKRTRRTLINKSV